MGAKADYFQWLLSKAKRMLKGGLSVKASAKLAGFKSQEHLSKVFCRQMNMKPACYRHVYQVRSPTNDGFESVSLVKLLAVDSATRIPLQAGVVLRRLLAGHSGHVQSSLRKRPKAPLVLPPR
jgi:hypothetical protein